MTPLPMTASTALPWSGPASGEAPCSTLLLPIRTLCQAEGHAMHTASVRWILLFCAECGVLACLWALAGLPLTPLMHLLNSSRGCFLLAAVRHQHSDSGHHAASSSSSLGHFH